MARCTVAEVEEIFETTLGSAEITACITVANIVVNNGPAASTSPSLDADTLKEIERWLAAHFASIQDPVALRVKIGDSEAWNWPAAVTTAWSTGYKLTPYGQMACSIDISGSLSSAGQKRGSFRASPREDSDFYTPRLTKS